MLLAKFRIPFPCWWCAQIIVLESSVNVVDDPTSIFCGVEFLCRMTAKTQSNINVMKIFLLK
jgi:hypothetical protein